MEKRKSMILTHYDEIIEEKCTIQENLEKLINQVFLSVDYIKNPPCEIKQKDCSLILKYQLEILTKFTEMNLELETIIDQNPLEQQLNITKGKCGNDTKLVQSKEVKSEISETPSFVKNRDTTEASADTDFDSVACSSAYYSQLISGNQNIETENDISNDDIQTLRETLKKFSEKLGLNAECMSSIKDYYGKPSTSNTQEFDKPSTSPISDFSFEKVEINGTNFEIPEKDTNVTISSVPNMKENSSCIQLPALSTSDSPESELKANGIDTSIPIQSIPESVPKEGCYAPDSSLSTELNTEILKSLITDENTSSEEAPLTDTEVNRIIDVMPNTADNICNNIEDGINDNDTVVYTTLEKLNNSKFLNRKEEALNKLLSTTNVPNIKLIPTGTKCSSVIKNNFVEDSNKLKKNKNRKDKSAKNNVIYELKPKTAPAVGTSCVFSHVESPSEFYIHVVDEESALVDLVNEQVNEFYMGSACPYKSKEEASSMIGSYCFAFIIQYKGWYRASVLDWDLDSKSDEVLLQLVDYGNKHRTTYKNLRKVNKELADIPMLAIRCHLPLMYPPSSTLLTRLTEWPSETIDAMLELSGLFHNDPKSNKFFEIVYAEQEGNSLAIDLYNPQENNEEETVGQILLNLGVAVQILEDHDDDNFELEMYLQDVDSLETADNINEAIIGYDPRDEARICRFTKSDGSCYKGKHCKLEHAPLSKDGFTTDTLPVFREAMYDLILPAHGEVVSLLITGYKDICNFFAQIVRTPHKEQGYHIDEDLYTLLANMNFPKTVATYETFKIAPAIGEIVIVQHYSKKWLRAVVRERVNWDNDNSGEVQAFSLDFGDYLKIPLCNVRKIKPNFLELPFQAVECYIDNYKAKSDCSPQEGKKFFCENLYFKNFVAVAMSTSLPLKIGIKTFNGINVGKTLVEKGFAEPRVNDKNPVDGCSVELY